MDQYEYVKQSCLKSTTKNPIELLNQIMSNDDIPMHGPIHHSLDGACLLSCLHACGCNFDLEKALDEMIERGKKMPGATCGQWGVCGSVSSLGASLSIFHQTSPLSNDEYYKDHMKLTSLILNKMSEIGGPRCCKRNAYLSMLTAIDFIYEKYGIALEKQDVKCNFSTKNHQCIGIRCPFVRCV